MTEQIIEDAQVATTMKSEHNEADITHLLNDNSSVNSDIEDDSSLRYILVPLAMLFSVLLLSALVLIMAKNRRRLLQIYRNRQHVTNFNYLDDDSDTTPLVAGDDMDDPTECLLKGKLQINNNSNKNNITNRYDTTNRTTTTNASSEFFT